MSQEFPTASLDITEDFHILNSAYVYICCSILKAKTYNWLPNTHTRMHARTHTSNNYKQKATGHVTSLANGHFNTGSDSPFMCKILTASGNKKRKYNFADIGLAVGMPTRFTGEADGCNADKFIQEADRILQNFRREDGTAVEWLIQTL